MTRNPIKDEVAIVGVGTTGFSRSDTRSPLAMALDASTRASATPASPPPTSTAWSA